MNSDKEISINEQRKRKLFSMLCAVVILVVVFLLAARMNQQLSPTDFIDYKAMDLKSEPINCSSLIEHEDRSGFSGRYRKDILDYEWESKYQFKQCRMKIDILKAESCKKSMSSYIRYARDYRDAMASKRMLESCTAIVDEELALIYLDGKIDSLLAKGALINIPHFSNMLNIHSISQVSVPYEKIKQGVYAVKMTSMDNIKYFAYFKTKENAFKFVGLLSLRLDQRQD